MCIECLVAGFVFGVFVICVVLLLITMLIWIVNSVGIIIRSGVSFGVGVLFGFLLLVMVWYCALMFGFVC